MGGKGTTLFGDTDSPAASALDPGQSVLASAGTTRSVGSILLEDGVECPARGQAGEMFSWSGKRKSGAKAG